MPTFLDVPYYPVKLELKDIAIHVYFKLFEYIHAPNFSGITGLIIKLIYINIG